jgi:hypothetical protein
MASGTVTQNATTTIDNTKASGMAAKDLHCLTIMGAAVCTITLFHLDQPTGTVYATGFTANTATYVMKGCTKIEILEDNTGAGTYTYEPYGG